MAAPKLNSEAKRLVIERVIAGDTNNEIRKKLFDAAFPSDLSDQAFSTYRQAPEVKAAIERKDSEAMQSGYAQRSERILKLAVSAKRFERRLGMTSESLDFSAGKPFDVVLLHKEYRETIDDIGKLVDPAKVQPLAVSGGLEIIYVNDWRNPEADHSTAISPSGAADSKAAS